MVDAVRPEDNYGHQRPPDDWFWNESAWFPSHVPERDVSGFSCINHRPNMNFSRTGLALWDPSGKETYDSPYRDWYEFAPLDESTETEMFDFFRAQRTASLSVAGAGTERTITRIG